jgi:hypothetical protein
MKTLFGIAIYGNNSLYIEWSWKFINYKSSSNFSSDNFFSKVEVVGGGLPVITFSDSSSYICVDSELIELIK